jgi:hypothetical protein
MKPSTVQLQAARDEVLLAFGDPPFGHGRLGVRQPAGCQFTDATVGEALCDLGFGRQLGQGEAGGLEGGQRPSEDESAPGVGDGWGLPLFVDIS